MPVKQKTFFSKHKFQNLTLQKKTQVVFPWEKNLAWSLHC